jgi:amino acid permease
MSTIVLYDAPGAEPLKGDILQALPSGSPLTLAVRASMIVVCLVSYPLCLVPASEVIEDMLLDSYLQPFLCSFTALRLSIRVLLVTTTTLVAAKIPSFVLVVSLIGCFCVGIVSFVFPPLFHYRLLIKQMRGVGTSREGGAAGTTPKGGVVVTEISSLLPQSAGNQSGRDAAAVPESARQEIMVDRIMIVIGIASTLFTSYLTLKTIVATWQQGGEVGGEVLHGFGVDDGPHPHGNPND